MDTLGSLYGLQINYFVSVDLNGFREAIDALGGTMIDVQLPVNDPFYPADDGRGYLKLYIPPGYHYMDGAEALAYARSRHGLGNDYIRAARQERVVTSVREQFDLSTLLQPGVPGQPAQDPGQQRQDQHPEQVAAKSDLARPVDRPQSPRLARPVATELRNRVLSVPAKQPVDDQAQRGGDQTSGRHDLHGRPGAAGAARRGRGRGCRRQRAERDDWIQRQDDAGRGLPRIARDHAAVPPVNGGAADNPNYPSTVITAYNGAEQNMTTTAKVLADTFGVTVQTATNTSQTADFVVIVGADTPTLKPPPGG